MAFLRLVASLLKGNNSAQVRIVTSAELKVILKILSKHWFSHFRWCWRKKQVTQSCSGLWPRAADHPRTFGDICSAWSVCYCYQHYIDDCIIQWWWWYDYIIQWWWGQWQWWRRWLRYDVVMMMLLVLIVMTSYLSNAFDVCVPWC